MHWRGHSADMQDRARYDDVVDDVRRELGERVEALVGAGIRPDDVLLDPVWASPSSPPTTGSSCAASTRSPPSGTGSSSARRASGSSAWSAGPGDRAPPLARDVATAATTLYAAQHGVWAVRVHDVAGTVDALDVADALRGDA